jgi:hypothetical protein
MYCNLSRTPCNIRVVVGVCTDLDIDRSRSPVLLFVINRSHREPHSVTTQDFIKFWGKIFVFILLVLIENSQGFKTFEFI